MSPIYRVIVFYQTSQNLNANTIQILYLCGIQRIRNAHDTYIGILSQFELFWKSTFWILHNIHRHCSKQAIGLNTVPLLCSLLQSILYIIGKPLNMTHSIAAYKHNHNIHTCPSVTPCQDTLLSILLRWILCQNFWAREGFRNIE